VGPPAFTALMCTAALCVATAGPAAAQVPESAAVGPDLPPGASTPSPDPAPDTSTRSTRQSTSSRVVVRQAPVTSAAVAGTASSQVSQTSVKRTTKPRKHRRAAAARHHGRPAGPVAGRSLGAGLVRDLTAVTVPVPAAEQVRASSSPGTDGRTLGLAALALLGVTAASASLISLMSRASHTGRWG
jgi:hypothetical protein